jgi:hypothetical protein
MESPATTIERNGTERNGTERNGTERNKSSDDPFKESSRSQGVVVGGVDSSTANNLRQVGTFDPFLARSGAVLQRVLGSGVRKVLEVFVLSRRVGTRLRAVGSVDVYSGDALFSSSSLGEVTDSSL